MIRNFEKELYTVLWKRFVNWKDNTVSDVHVHVPGTNLRQKDAAHSLVVIHINLRQVHVTDETSPSSSYLSFKIHVSK